MATTPYFILSPNLVLSLVGLLHGPDKTKPTPIERWEDATVDVVIPALNEEKNIILCIASLLKQTLRPKHIILIDDGSTDKTKLLAEQFCREEGIKITIIHRDHPIGKTVTIKRQARECNTDVEFILDADTILESPNYIQRVVEELYQANGIASACGTILPTRDIDRDAQIKSKVVSSFIQHHPGVNFYLKQDLLHRLARKLSNIYREVLYLFLQKFVYHGQMVFFGSITNPVGCAVAYRRKYIKELFDHYEPIFGDDITNSEDIFIGFALIKHGYRNIQLTDVFARSQEPEVEELPHQIYLWSSSFLQSCYYFDDLVKSPFKSFKRYRYHHRQKQLHHAKIQEMRAVAEPYRQAFGDKIAEQYGRPMGWVILLSLVEKVFFPIAILLMIAFQLWEPLIITVVLESIISTSILMLISPGKRIEMFFKGLLATPFRYASILYDFVTIVRFSIDIWFRNNRKWRK